MADKAKQNQRSKLRTALVLGWHPDPPYTGGSFKCQFESFSRHHDARYRWILLDKEHSNLFELANNNLEFHSYGVPSAIKKLTAISFILGRLIEWPYVMASILIKSLMLAGRSKIDVVYLPIAESSQFTFIAMILRAILRVEVVGLLHQFGRTDRISFVDEVKAIRGMKANAGRKITAFVEVLVVHTLQGGLKKRLAKLNRLGAISPELAVNTERMLSRRVVAMHYGFDPNPYISAPEEKKIYDAAYLGRLIETKGIDDLLQVWKIVVRTLPEAKLALIGDGNPAFIADLGSNIERLGLSRNITLLGQKFGKEKIALLKQSKSFIFLSHLESYADVINEAIACQLPVVAYDLPAYSTRQSHCQHFYTFTVGSYQDIAQIEVKILTSPEAYINDIEPGVLTSWDDFAKQEERLVFGEA